MKERFLSYVEFEKRYSPHTVTAYRTDLNNFSDFLERKFQIKDIPEANHFIIRSWLVELSERGMNTRSISRKISTLRAFYRFLLKEKLVTNDPTVKIQAPKFSKRLPIFVEQSGMELLLTQVEFGDGFTGLRNRMILEVLYATGMRCSEMVNLKIRDIDFGNNTFRVFGKRNKERIIPFSPGLGRQLRIYLGERAGLKTGHEYCFITDKGSPIYQKMVYLIVRKYLGTVTTLRKRSPHVLRHTFATHLLNNGAELNTVKELLGHADLSATQVYTHNTIEKLKNVYHQAHPRA